jgi:hypothetical protein
MTKALVAAIVALLTVISVPASAQKCDGQDCNRRQENATRSPSRPPPPGDKHFPGPPHQGYPRQGSQQPIYVYPQFVYPPFVGLCVVIDVGTCRVFAAPDSYCECKSDFGEVFSGIVQ